MKKFAKGYVEKIDNEAGTLAVAVASDGSVDRDDERIAPEGWDFTNFLKNPVLLWAHNYREEPLGKVISIAREGPRLLFQPQFAVGISEMAKRIFEYYKAGVLNAFSVGFIPREWKDEAGPSGEQVRTFTKTELLEISCVPVPANPNALVLARSKGIDIDQLKKDIEEMGGEIKDEPLQPLPAAKSPACRMDNETPEQCMSRKIPEMMAEGMSHDQAVAAAMKMCQIKCSDKTLKDEVLDAVDLKLDALRNEIKSDLEATVTQLKNFIAGANGAGTGGGASEKKVDPTSGVTPEQTQDVKRLLQLIDRALGQMLHNMKQGAR